MSRPPGPTVALTEIRAGHAAGESRQVLIWSSLRTAAPPWPASAGRPPRWLLAPWADVPPLLRNRSDGQALWVLEPDPLSGPSAQALHEALQQAPCRPHTLVLLPEVWQHEGARWLDAGADRCMPADSPPRLLQAMVQAMRRRCQGMVSQVSVFGPLRFDQVSQSLFHGEGRIWLTGRETQVAALLFRSGQQRTHAVDVLLALGANGAHSGNKALVALYVHRLNRKIRPLGVQIDAVRGCGYSLRLTTPVPPQVPAPRPPAHGLTQWLRPAPAANAANPVTRP